MIPFVKGLAVFLSGKKWDKSFPECRLTVLVGDMYYTWSRFLGSL